MHIIVLIFVDLFIKKRTIYFAGVIKIKMHSLKRIEISSHLQFNQLLFTIILHNIAIIIHTKLILGVTAIEWPSIWNDLKIRYGEEAFCLKTSVAVLMNNQFLGGLQELKDFLKEKYTYNITIDYYNKAIQAFVERVRSSQVRHDPLIFYFTIFLL